MRSGTKACCEEEQRGEASSGIYTYKHSGAKGVKKSRTHVQLSFAGVIFLLAIVWQSLLWKIEEINGAVASSLQQQECLVRCQTTLPQRLLHAPQMPSPHHTIGAPLPRGEQLSSCISLPRPHPHCTSPPPSLSSTSPPPFLSRASPPPSPSFTSPRHPPRAHRRRYPPHARRRCHPPRTRVSHHHSTDEKWNFSAAAVLDLLQRWLICRAKVTPSSNRGDGRRGLPRWRDGSIVTGRRCRSLPLEFLPSCCSCTTSYCSPTSMTRVLLHDKLLPGRRRIQ